MATKRRAVCLFVSTFMAMNSISFGVFANELRTEEGIVSNMTEKLTTQEAEETYKTLRNKWYERLTGNNVVNPDDEDYKASMVNVAEKAQIVWDSMNKEDDRTELWSNLNTASESADITAAFRNLLTMATAYNSKNCDLYENEDLKKDIIQGLDWMYIYRYNENSSIYKNWWDWDIGAPQALCDALILMYDDLTPEHIAKQVKTLNHFNPKPLEVPGGPNPLTGANLLDTALVSALKGLIGESSIALTEASESISAVLPYVTKGDGFYKDGSFIQHGDIPYAGGYGGVLMNCLDKLLFIFDKTDWEVKDPQIVNVYDWILNAYAPVYYRGAIMDMTSGRGISRYNSSDHNKGKGPLQPMLNLSYTAPKETGDRIRAFIKENILSDKICTDYFKNMNIKNMLTIKELLADESIPESRDLKLHKVYGSMDRVVHHTEGFSLGISMYSSRIGNFEIGNGENKKGFHTSDGMLYLYNEDTTQYSDSYWPTADMMRLPGTTTDGTDGYIARDWKGYRNSKDWVGGSSILDLYGATGMDFEMETSPVKAKKSWFSFDDEIVCLGTDIKSTDGKLVETIVENRKIKDNGDNTLIINGETKSTTIGSTEKIDTANWAFLGGNTEQGTDSIGYYFPEGTNLTTLREARTGNWKEINDGGPATPITKNYLSLAIEHGANPTNGAYSYVLLPNKSSTEVQQYSENPNITILANTPDVQAVKENNLGVIGLNFWKPSTVDGITSNKEASVMIKLNDDTIEIAVSDPTQKNTGTIELELAVPVTSVVSKDDTITVTEAGSKIKLSVNVAGSTGSSQKIVLNRDKNALVEIADVVSTQKIYVSKKTDFNNVPLPQKVIATTNDTKRHELNVTWNEGTYNKEVDGIYEVYGTLQLPDGMQNTANIMAKAEVVVGDIEILSITNPQKLTIEKGISFEDIAFPQKVQVLANDNKTYEVEVEWQKGNYNENVGGIHEIMGTLKLPQNLYNTNNITAKIELMVGNTEIVSITNPDMLSVAKGTDFNTINFAKKVSVKANDNKSYDVNVIWNKGTYDENIDDLYEITGTLQLPEGLYNSNNLKPVITVRVGSTMITIDDTYVQGGKDADKTNTYGNGGSFVIKTVPVDQAYTRKSLIKFDITDFPTNFDEAFIELQVSGSQFTENIKICEVYSIETDWTNKDITFNTVKRIGDSPVVTFTPNDIKNKMLDINVTEAVKSAKRENKNTIAFEISIPLPGNNNGDIYFYSKENTAGAKKPTLSWSKGLGTAISESKEILNTPNVKAKDVVKAMTNLATAIAKSQK